MSRRIFRGFVAGFCLRGRHGGVEKREGGGKPHELVRCAFHPLRCRCSVFPVQESKARSSFGRVQKFSGERVLWYAFLPPYVLHPPISRPNFLLIFVGKKCPEKSSRKTPGKILQNLCNKNPRQFSAEGPGQYLGALNAVAVF